MLETIDQLSKASNGEDVIKLAESKSLINFQSIDQIIEHVRVVRDNGFNEQVMIFYNLIAYFIDGKIITEGLGVGKNGNYTFFITILLQCFI